MQLSRNNDSNRNKNEGNDQCSHHSDKEQQAICESYIEMEAKLHLYAVSAGRVFMFAPSYVGETFKLPHVPNTNNNVNELML